MGQFVSTAPAPAAVVLVSDRVHRTAGNVTTTSTTFVTLTGASITVVTGARAVLISFFGTLKLSVIGSPRMNIAIDTTRQMGTTGQFYRQDTADAEGLGAIGMRSAALTAASHDFIVEWLVPSGTGTILGTGGTPYDFYVAEIQ